MKRVVIYLFIVLVASAMTCVSLHDLSRAVLLLEELVRSHPEDAAVWQGLGRLIRHRGDRGLLAVLDPRLRTMGYGRRFLDSFPPAPVTHDFTAVERFFESCRTLSG